MRNKKCFVVMGYGERHDYNSGKKINLDIVYKDIIKPAVVACGYECVRGDEVLDSCLIDKSMYYGILESDLVIADLTTLNPNAIYELGVRHGVKKFRTVIMMENHDQFFFDLNHIRTITYSYYSNANRFCKEAEKVRNRLVDIIRAIDKKEQVDSPLYSFINDLQEPLRQGSRNHLRKSRKSLYERIIKAVDLKRNKKFKKAYVEFKALSIDHPSDPFFKQQMALCLYKSNTSSLELLDQAFHILKPLSKSIDPETNGIIGAIFKSRYYLSNNKKDLNSAINAYKKAYVIYSDSYTGENYAFCLLEKSLLVSGEEKNELKVMSRSIYREIFKKYQHIDLSEINTEYELWIIASLASCCLVLKKKKDYEIYDSFFLSKANVMMKSSYSKQKERLVELLK